MICSQQEETLKSFFDDFTSRACSEEGWNETLAWLRTSIWPSETKKDAKVHKKDTKVDKKDVNVAKKNMKSGQSNENLIAFSLRMQGKLLNDVTKLKL
jgi:hypothetical protein